MKIERTFNPRDVLAILEDPEVRAAVWEDEAAPGVLLHPQVYNLAVKLEQFADGAVSDVLIGFVTFVPVNGITWNPHIAILPKYRGNGTEAMRRAVEWMFNNSPCRKVVAYPPVFRKNMIRVFEKCGFEREGYSPKSSPWAGAVHDRILMGKGA